MGIDLNSIGYGLLLGALGIVSIAFLFSNKRANDFENEAQKEETLVKVQAKKEEDNAEPIEKAISDFDSELDSDNKSKG